MKVELITVDQFQLIPENDAERVILNRLCGQTMVANVEWGAIPIGTWAPNKVRQATITVTGTVQV